MLAMQPNQARHTLGLMLSLNGDPVMQNTTCLHRIEVFCGKLSNCRISTYLHWKAIKIILELGILYPMMATLYDDDDLLRLENEWQDSIITILF
jgi:hypothetical protein